MYYNENTIVYHNGSYISAGEAKGSLYDQSLHYGYAAFEGIRAYDTDGGVKIFKATEHYERLKNSCEAVHIPYPFNNDELIEITYKIIKLNGLNNAYIRPLVTVSPNMSLTKGKEASIFIGAWEWSALLGEKLLKVGTSSYRRITPATLKVEAKISGHYVNSIIASQEARNQGFDEALLLDVDGFVAEAPGANFFIEKDGVLFTPQLGSILPGITRATVLELCQALEIDVVEKKILPEEVLVADSAFLCGTAAEVIGIASIDNISFNKEWSTTVGATIQKAYRNLVLEKEYQTLLDVA